MFDLLVLKSVYHYRCQFLKSMQNLQLGLKIHQNSLLQPVMGTEMRSFLMVCVLPTVQSHLVYAVLTYHRMLLINEKICG